MAHPCGFRKGGDFELWAQDGYAAGSLDAHSFGARGCLMEFNLRHELQAELAHIAAEKNGGAGEYVCQFVEHYLDQDAWFRQQVEAGLGELDRSGFVTHEEIGVRIDQLLLCGRRGFRRSERGRLRGCAFRLGWGRSCCN